METQTLALDVDEADFETVVLCPHSLVRSWGTVGDDSETELCLKCDVVTFVSHRGTLHRAAFWQDDTLVLSRCHAATGLPLEGEAATFARRCKRCFL